MKALEEYIRKRDFKKTREPVAKVAKSKQPIFVVQEHHASHLHYDFRLEMEGVLKSWAVPKGPSFDPSVKRLAVEVEDHPLAYAKFTGEIPAGEYGAGTVYTWDTGTFLPVGDPIAGLKKGRIEFSLKGKKLKGAWLLVRTGRPSSKAQWLLFKRHDEYAHEGEIQQVAGDTPTKKASPRVAKTSASAAKAPAAKKASKAAKAKAPAKKTAGKASRKKGALPDFVTPQLALLVEKPPEDASWIHELKYDGYRILARLDKKGVRLFTRNEQDWTKKYPSIAEALGPIKDRQAFLDGEVVWVNEDGSYDFQRLQNSQSGAKVPGSLGYFVFDITFLDGEDLRPLPLLERKQKLEELLGPLKGGPVVYSGHIDGGADRFLHASCEAQLEGIISKLADAPYAAGRQNSWVKSKCKMRQEFVVAGFTEEQGSRVGFGALLLGVAEEVGLRYVGKVGTGFNRESLLELRERFRKLEQKQCPFTKNAPKGRGLHWLKPDLVAEISFAHWTNDQMLRVPVFHGLRGDKPASQVKAEKASKGSGPIATQPAGKKWRGAAAKKPGKSAAKAKPGAAAASNGKLPGLTHPDKIIYPKEKLTKLDVRDFYLEAAPFLLPHIDGRPLSLLRCPEGVGGACFMQKHLHETLGPGLAAVPVDEEKGRTEYVRVTAKEGLAALVQKNVLELHARGSRAESLDRPDLLVMDFDPGPGVSFKRVVAGAKQLKEILDQLGLESFVKVTGGKGLHVHVPLEPKHSWEQLKAFAHALARELTAREPKLYVTQMAKKIREGKIFLDYLRNAEGQTAVAPYSLRAKEKSSVAMPVEWEQLDELKSANQFTLPRALEEIRKRKRDPWEGFSKVKQKIEMLKNAG